TAIPGIFAAGECACVSVHGANRLGGNSLLDAVVFGIHSGREALKFVKSHEMLNYSKSSIEAEEVWLSKLLNRQKGEKAAIIRTEMEKAMITSFGIFRSGDLMMQGLEEIVELKKRYNEVIVDDNSKVYNLDLIRVLELGYMLDLAHVVAVGAIARKESRGAHFRDDFKEIDNENFLRHTMVQKDTTGNPQIDYKEVVIEDIEPLSEIKY
ncbi:hypothetical protein B6I21_08720, partial [candidate division KSB1 bacterium 4572_119]